jgi:hypothetical protein
MARARIADEDSAEVTLYRPCHPLAGFPRFGGEPDSDRLPHLAGRGEVLALAALAGVSASAALEDVLAPLAEQLVIAATAGDDVVTAAGLHLVRAAQARDHVGAGCADDLVGPAGSPDRRDLARAEDASRLGGGAGWTLTVTVPSRSPKANSSKLRIWKESVPRKPAFGV